MKLQDITSQLQNPSPADGAHSEALAKEGLALVEKAYKFAEKVHESHKRLSGEPYFIHLFETAKTLASLGMSAPVVASGLLHDCMEDVGVSAETLEKEFGPEIRFMVDGVTKLGKIKYQGATRYRESLRKLFVAMSQDIRVLIIKLSDRLHNIKTLAHVPKEKQLRIAKETLEIYAPIANRLGIKKLQRELEDMAFPFVYPEDYEKIRKLLNIKKGEQEEKLDKFQKSLKKELAKNNITDFRMDHRIKSVYSLYKKLQKMNWNVESIYDISALRVIVKDVADCYKILGIIHSQWRPLPNLIKDYIASPKLSGYQSLHTTVFTGDGGIVEVQIRTEEMHKEAEYGIASHISYKEGVTRPKAGPNLQWIKKLLPNEKRGDQKQLSTNSDVPQWVKELADYQKWAGADAEFVDEIKNDFFEERIFVFTPMGDVIDLPAGSSVVDFAFAIHSDIGYHMSGAKVNGKMVSLDTELSGGDRVEVITKKSAKPNYKWIEFCKTTMAKRHIKNALEERGTR